MRGSVSVAGLAFFGTVAAGRGANSAGAPSLRASFQELVVCRGRRLYVSGTGDDRNDGTLRSPYREIQRAVDTAAPGDLVLVGRGVFAPFTVHAFRGAPGAWLGIMSADDAHPRPRCFAAEGNAVAINGSTYVGVYGLEVVGRQHAHDHDGSGINVYGNSHHIAVWKNVVHDFPGGGINCFDVDDRYGFGSHDLVDIRFNTVYDTSQWSTHGTSGISIFRPRDLTAGATWDGRYGYRIVANYVYNIENRVPFSKGGYSFVTDGNAVSLDSFSKYGYLKPTLVEGNLVVGCGGRGVHVYKSRFVDGVGNTAIGNLRSRSPVIDGGAELEGTTDESVRFHGNVILPRHSPNWRDARSAYTQNVVLGGHEPVGGTNVDRRTEGYGYFHGPLGDAALLTGQSISVFAPRRQDRAARLPGALGWQTLGVARRPNGAWAAGSLEPLSP